MSPSASVLLAEHGGKKNVASAFAWFETARKIAGALGMFVTGILLTWTHSNYSFVFLLGFFLSVSPLLIVLFFVKNRNHGEEEAGEAVTDTNLTSLPMRPPGRFALLSYVGLGLLITGTGKMLSALFPVLATEYAGLTEAETGLVYLVSVIIAVVAGPVFGWLSDHVSHGLVLSMRSMANVASSSVYIVFPSFPGLLVGRPLDVMGKVAFSSAWGSLMARVSGHDRSRRGRIMSYMSMGEDFGGILGPVLAGFIWATWGVVTMLCVRIALAIFTELYSLRLTKKLKQDQWSGDVSGMSGQDRRIGS